MKKEINPAVAVVVIVVILVLIGGFFWRAQEPRVLPPVMRGSAKPSGSPASGGSGRSAGGSSVSTPQWRPMPMRTASVDVGTTVAEPYTK